MNSVLNMNVCNTHTQHSCISGHCRAFIMSSLFKI